MRLWNLDNDECISLIGHTGQIYCLQFDGNTIISSSLDNTIRIWDLLGNQLAVLKDQTGVIVAIHWNPKLNRLISASSDKTGKYLIKKKNKNKIRKIIVNLKNQKIANKLLYKLKYYSKY